MHRKNSIGFTLVELLIVIVVIAILATISVVTYSGIQARAKDTALQTKINSAQKIIELYKINNNHLPKREENRSMVLLENVPGIDGVIGEESDGIDTVYYTSFGDNNEYCAYVWDSTINIAYVATQDGIQKYTSPAIGATLCLVNSANGASDAGAHVETAKPLVVIGWTTGR